MTLKGCLDPFHAKLQCSIKADDLLIDCCHTDLCNNKHVDTDALTNKPILTEEQWKYVWTVLIIFGSALVLIMIGFGLKRLHDWFNKRNKQMCHDSTGMYSQALLTTLTPEEQRTTSTAIEDTSGSGKGYANLEARTIAKDAKYIGDSPIGKGRYGEGNILD